MGRQEHGKKPKAKKAAIVLSEMRDDIRSLNSSILIISQKMKYLVRNEKILGRNLIVLNKKIKLLEEKVASGNIGNKASEGGASEELAERVDEFKRKLNEVQAEISSVKQGVASQEQLQEIKYVIDSINPLELTTLAQVKELIDEKMAKAKKK